MRRGKPDGLPLFLVVNMGHLQRKNRLGSLWLKEARPRKEDNDV